MHVTELGPEQVCAWVRVLCDCSDSPGALLSLLGTLSLSLEVFMLILVACWVATFPVHCLLCCLALWGQLGPLNFMISSTGGEFGPGVLCIL